ncbi:hypothetical protein MTO96_019201 [Rhipicephalus appendiculatus]
MNHRRRLSRSVTTSRRLSLGAFDSVRFTRVLRDECDSTGDHTCEPNSSSCGRPLPLSSMRVINRQEASVLDSARRYFEVHCKSVVAEEWLFDCNEKSIKKEVYFVRVDGLVKEDAVKAQTCTTGAQKCRSYLVRRSYMRLTSELTHRNCVL